MGIEVAVRIAGDASQGAAAIDQIVSRLGKLDTAQKKSSETSISMGDALGKVNGVLGQLGAGATIAGVLSAAGAVEQLGERSAETRSTLDALSGGQANRYIDSITEASDGMINRMDAAQISNRALNQGFVTNADQMRDLSKAATVFADVMGSDTVDAENTLIDAIGRANPRMLAQLGIIQKGKDFTAEVNQLMKDNGSLSFTQANQLAAFNAVMERANELQAAGVGAQRSAADSTERLAASWKNLTAQWGEGLATVAQPSVEAMNTVTEGTVNFNNAVADQRQRLMDTTDSFDQYVAIAKTIPGLQNEVSASYVKGVGIVTTSLDRERAAWDANRTAIVNKRAAVFEATTAARESSVVTVDWAAKERDAAQAVTESSKALAELTQAMNEQSAIQLRTENQVKDLTGLWWGAGTATKGTTKAIADLSKELDSANLALTKQSIAWNDATKHSDLATFNMDQAREKVDGLTKSLDEANQKVSFGPGANWAKIFDFTTQQMSQMGLSQTQMLDKFNELGLATGQVTELQIAQGTALRELDNLYATGAISVDTYLQGLSQIPAAQDAATASSIATQAAVAEATQKMADAGASAQSIIQTAIDTSLSAKKAASGGTENADAIIQQAKDALDKINALPGASLKVLPDAALQGINTIKDNINQLVTTDFEPAKITTDIAPAQKGVDEVKGLLAGINDKTVTVTVQLNDQTGQPSSPAGPSGGQQQHGTISAPGGLTLVGESGPELIPLNRGTPVVSNSQLQSLISNLMAGGGQGGDTFVIENMGVTTPDRPSLRDLAMQAKRQARNVAGR